MYSDGHEVDGSWVLRVYVTDLQVERSLRVKGELHIGGVMLRLVEDLGGYSSKARIVVTFRLFCYLEKIACTYYFKEKFSTVISYDATIISLLYLAQEADSLIFEKIKICLKPNLIQD
ncbi:Fermitin family-like protein 2 [Camponotus floridanus]|uniref:Fermitin family-like protein 2 n=1 Tax=Camponotus floridanus TaxID=104421 RepID=E2AH62_CAMFO|nr:Fermitin family-like protein 2 [Camponotus floridanus]